MIDTNGNQLGVMSPRKGVELAAEQKLDLVKIAPNAKPPVCRILDYGKYKYEMAKREKEAKKNQRVINVKEIRLTPNIAEHDLKVKARRAIEFLESGDRVKVSVRFRGREMGHKELGREVLDDFIEFTKDVGEVDKAPKMEGRNMTMFLSAKSDKDK